MAAEVTDPRWHTVGVMGFKFVLVIGTLGPFRKERTFCIIVVITGLIASRWNIFDIDE